MSAVVVAVDAPCFGCPIERAAWSHKRSSPEDLHALEPDVQASSKRMLGAVRVMLNPDWSPALENKHGQDYVPTPSSDDNH
jgi:hypothetical protein